MIKSPTYANLGAPSKVHLEEHAVVVDPLRLAEHASGAVARNSDGYRKETDHADVESYTSRISDHDDDNGSVDEVVGDMPARPEGRMTRWFRQGLRETSWLNPNRNSVVGGGGGAQQNDGGNSNSNNNSRSSRFLSAVVEGWWDLPNLVRSTTIRGSVRPLQGDVPQQPPAQQQQGGKGQFDPYNVV